MANQIAKMLELQQRKQKVINTLGRPNQHWGDSWSAMLLRSCGDLAGKTLDRPLSRVTSKKVQMSLTIIITALKGHIYVVVTHWPPSVHVVT